MNAVELLDIPIPISRLPERAIFFYRGRSLGNLELSGETVCKVMRPKLQARFLAPPVSNGEVHAQ